MSHRTKTILAALAPAMLLATAASAAPILAVDEFGYNASAGSWRVDRHIRELADVNGDGRADVVGFGDLGVYVALANTNGTFQQPVLALRNFGYNAGSWRVSRHPRMLADINGDGRADIVAFGNTGVHVALANANGTFQQARLVLDDFGYNVSAGAWRVDRHLRMLADINGDDRADIVGFGDEGVYVALANTNGSFQEARLAVNSFGYDLGAGRWRITQHPRMLADVDGDGRADIVGFGNAGAYVALANANGTFGNPRLAVRNFGYTAGWRVNRHPRMLADVTGDGRADIIAIGDAGAFVAVSTSNGNFQLPRLAVRNYGYGTGWRVERHPRMLGDITGEGRADIVGFGNSGVIVSLSSGGGNFLPGRLVVSGFGYNPGAGSWRIDRHPRMLADVNGDGRADIVGFGNRGVLVSLSNGDGTFQ